MKTCKICSPYLLGQEGVIYNNRVYVVGEPPYYQMFKLCEPILQVDGKYLYSINDGAIEGDCFVIDKNTVIVQLEALFGLVDVFSGEFLIDPLCTSVQALEEKISQRIEGVR